MRSYLSKISDEICEYPYLKSWRALALFILVGYVFGFAIIGMAYLIVLVFDFALSILKLAL